MSRLKINICSTRGKKNPKPKDLIGKQAKDRNKHITRKKGKGPLNSYLVKMSNYIHNKMNVN